MTPPYHLRPNKAVDRLMLVEALKRVFTIKPAKEYTYYSLAGPFLEDSKLIHQFFPETKLVSLEEKPEEYKRQRFHRFCRHIKLLEVTLKDFLVTFESKGRQIFWIDYTGFKYENLAWFGELLTKVSDFSVVRITVQCNLEGLKNKPATYEETKERDAVLAETKNRFENDFRGLISVPLDIDVFTDVEKYRRVVQDLIQVQSQNSLPAIGGRVFQVLNSSVYRDTTGMLSVTGIVIPTSERTLVAKQFKSWKFANLKWRAPIPISVPVLSVQERLSLQKHLPLRDKITQTYLKCLGYRIGDSASQHLKMMENYADFHAYYPFFARITV